MLLFGRLCNSVAMRTFDYSVDKFPTSGMFRKPLFFQERMFMRTIMNICFGVVFFCLLLSNGCDSYSPNNFRNNNHRIETRFFTRGQKEYNIFVVSTEKERRMAIYPAEYRLRCHYRRYEKGISYLIYRGKEFTMEPNIAYCFCDDDVEPVEIACMDVWTILLDGTKPPVPVFAQGTIVQGDSSDLETPDTEPDSGKNLDQVDTNLTPN